MKRPDPIGVTSNFNAYAFSKKQPCMPSSTMMEGMYCIEAANIEAQGIQIAEQAYATTEVA